MKLVLNIEHLKTHGLTPNEFALMFLIHVKAYAFLHGEDGNILRMSDSEIIATLKRLQAKRFIKIGYAIDSTNDLKYSSISLRSSFLELLEGRDVVISNDVITDWFQELRDVFPTETPNGRRLHTNLAATKKKYLGIVKGDINLHKNILKCVTFEHNLRKRLNSLNFMKALSAYVNQQEWTVYMKDVLNQKSDGQEEPPNKWTKSL